MNELTRIPTEAGDHIVYIDGRTIVWETPDGGRHELTEAQAAAFGDQLLAASRDAAGGNVAVNPACGSAHPKATD